MAVSRLAERVFWEYFQEERAEQLHTFFEKIWKSRYMYKVFMARRAFNLNYTMMKLFQVEGNPGYYTKSIMSNTGLLLSSEELASYYLKWKKFPGILICDDILIHGRSIIRLVNKLSQCLYLNVRRGGILISQERLKQQLLEAISIYVFVRDDSGILLNSDYKIRAEQRLPMFRIRELSQQISDFLQGCGTANTSFVLSVQVPVSYWRCLFQDRSSVNDDRAFCYRGREQLIYYRNQYNCLQTVRIRCPDGYSNYGGLITSLVLIKTIDSGDFEAACHYIAGWLQRYITDGRIIKIMRSKGEQLAEPKMQFLLFLMSVFCTADFCRDQFGLSDDNVYHMLLRSDYRKITSNFGYGRDLAKEVEELFKVISYEHLNSSWLYREINRLQNPAVFTARIPASPDFIQIRMHASEGNGYIYAEDIMYSQGVMAEKEARRYLEKKQPYKADTLPMDIIELSKYLSFMNSKGVDHDVSSIAFMLGLIDSGLAAFNVEEEKEGESFCIKSVLKAGELATSVYMRRYSVFVPALALVEQKFRWVGVNKKNVIRNFIEYLRNHCYQSYGESKEEDRRQLRELQRDAEDVLRIYEGRQRFQDWNVNLVIRGDRTRNQRNKTERHFSEREEQLRKKFYLDCAVHYLHFYA